MLKIKLYHYIILIWVAYMAYSAVFGSLLLFPKDSFEIILPAVMQTLSVVVFIRLFKEKYLTIISLTALAFCLLLIRWHFNLDHGISRRQIVMLFWVLPIFTTAVTYLVGKIKKVVALSVWKNFGISLLITFTNFLMAIFTFYVFHYWI